MTPRPGAAPAAIAAKPLALRAHGFATTAATTLRRAIRQHQHQQQPTPGGATSSHRAGASASHRSQPIRFDRDVLPIVGSRTQPKLTLPGNGTPKHVAKKRRRRDLLMDAPRIVEPLDGVA
jgi:hypothetical protein